MKTLKCDMCDYKARGENFEEWMEVMKVHYAETHADFMRQNMSKSAAEKTAGMEKWMAENRARFDARPKDK